MKQYKKVSKTQYERLLLLLLSITNILPRSGPRDHPKKGCPIFQVLSVACSIAVAPVGPVAPTRAWGMGMNTAWHEVMAQPAPGVPEGHPSLEQWSPLPRSHTLAAMPQPFTIWGYLPQPGLNPSTPGSP